MFAVFFRLTPTNWVLNCLHFPVSLSVMTIRFKFVTYTRIQVFNDVCIIIQNQNNSDNQIFNSTVSVNYINIRNKEYF